MHHISGSIIFNMSEQTSTMPDYYLLQSSYQFLIKIICFAYLNIKYNNVTSVVRQFRLLLTLMFRMN